MPWHPDPLSRMEEWLVYLEGSLTRAAEYIGAFRDSCAHGLWRDAQVYLDWLRNAYLTLPALAAHAQETLAALVELPSPARSWLNTRLGLALDGIQILGESVRAGTRQIEEAAHEPR